MKSRQPNIYLWLAISVVGIISTIVTQRAWADVKVENNTQKASLLQQGSGERKIRQLSELEIPLTSAQHLLVQSPTPNNPASQRNVIPITGVKANPTDKGVEVILETPVGTQLQVTNRSTGNNFIVDVSGGQLRLPSGEAFTFRSEKPLAGITEITVTNVDANTVRVTVVGVAAMPTVELYDDNAGLVFAVAPQATATQPPQQPQIPANQTPQEKPAAQEDEPIELVVTGEQDGYSTPNATTATKTDTPLRDIPQSIQVVPRQVLEDRNVRNLREALETVSGVAPGSRTYGDTAITPSRTIRGFRLGGNTFRNGLPDGDGFSLSPIGTLERLEVLKGPASVLFGAGEPGGIVNLVTKKPLSDPYYKLAFEAGSYGLYQPSIDLSGPLNADKTLLYRFVANYQGSSDFQGFSDTRLIGIAPSISLRLGERTHLYLYYEYTRLLGDPPAGGTNAVLLSDGSLTPRNFATYYPNFTLIDIEAQKFGYTLEHRFNNNWQIRNHVAVNLTQVREDVAGFGSTLVDDRFLNGFTFSRAQYPSSNYFGNIELLGKFMTGAISHQVLTGFDFNRSSYTGDRIRPDTSLPPLDIRNPNYDIPTPEFSKRGLFSDYTEVRYSYGVYFQDQIALGDNLKFLIGSRFDWVSSNTEGDFITPGEITVLPTRNDFAFSPRIGLVYQPSQDVSLYASYTRSFSPLIGFDNVSPDPNVNFEPTRGTQYEVGVKADFLDSRLSATLAAYQLTKTNVLTPDPNNPELSIQTGEQRSRGIELDIAGEILQGLKVIGSYAYTDAKVTEDKVIPVGNRVPNVPENQVSLWTTYEIQKGSLKGLGFGLGLFYVGTWQGDSDNSFQLGDYFRTDAALYYRTGRLKAAINFRNLFDIDAAAYADSRTIVQRTEPFTITGSISWEF